jgi:NADH dehydrogenase
MARPRIVIVGAGFGGLAAAKALRKTPARVILVDRTNHHLFQPLLYQVATSASRPAKSPPLFEEFFASRKTPR